MYIKVRVKAGSKKEEVVISKQESFSIFVKEPATRNLANKRARELIANHYSLPIGKVRIVNGHHSPSKLFVVDSEN